MYAIRSYYVHDYPRIAVTAEYGNVLICARAGDRLSNKLEEKAKSLCRDMEGINNLEVHIGAVVPPQRYLGDS